MRASWVGRQILALILLAVLLVVVSGFLGLIVAVRLATHQARVEGELVSGAVTSELSRFAGEASGRSLDEIASDPRFDRVLRDAIVHAPSVLSVAILSPDGHVVAHTVPTRIGELASSDPPLPDVSTLSGAVATLWELARVPSVYQIETSLSAGKTAYAKVRVVIAGTFLWALVKDAAVRALVTALVVVALAAFVALALGRIARDRFRDLERGITALSEGRVEPIPESGMDEFARLARGLNLVAARLAPTAASGAPTPPIDPSILAAQSRAVAHLGELTAGVAHELRNELQAVNLDLAALRQMDTESEDAKDQQVDRVAGGLSRLDGAIRGFLKIARVRPPAPRAVDLNAMLEELCDHFGNEAALAGVTLKLDLEAGLPKTQADPEVLQQALQNLLRNSLQALVGREDGVITLATARADRLLRMIVRDNGPGIPPEIRDRLLDLYFTTRPDGTGVGLAVVRHSIEMHGGCVAIGSTSGEGTEVILEIPWVLTA
ncbi:MAG: ATP-binding protein [Candidatus Eisenbacteria bacterium]